MSLPQDIYQRKPLTDPSRQIRLVQITHADDPKDKIHCTLIVFELAGSPPFKALSYVWGDAKITDSILLDGQPMQVTTNLIAALKRIRSLDNCNYIWIDALCIDQSSTLEKNEQVPLMCGIYGGADEILTWLGEQAGGSDKVFEFIRSWKRISLMIDLPKEYSSSENWVPWAMETLSRLKTEFDSNPESCSDPCDGMLWKSIRFLLERKYWTRAWIVQEAVLARSVLLLCGDKSNSLEDLISFSFCWELIFSNADPLLFGPTTRIAMHIVCQADGANIIIAQRRRMESSESINELFTVSEVCRQDATDDRDRIYAVLGLVPNIGKLTKVDYSLTTTEVYRNFVFAIHKLGGRLDWLGLAGLSLSALKEQRPQSSPTWQPDFARLPRFSGFSSQGIHSATGSNKAICSFDQDMHQLKTAGKYVDRVIAVSSVLEHAPDVNSWVQMCWEMAAVHYKCTSSAGLPWWQNFFMNLVPMASEIKPQERIKLICFLIYFVLGMAIPEEPGEDPAKCILGVYTMFTDPDILSEETITKMIDMTFEHLSSQLTDLGSALEMDGTENMKTVEGQQAIHAMFFTVIASFAQERRFFITEKGYMGNSPSDLAVNDGVCLVLGCSVPLMCRSVEDDKFKIVGEAYIHGMMQGELLENVADQNKYWDTLEFV